MKPMMSFLLASAVILTTGCNLIESEKVGSEPAAEVGVTKSVPLSISFDSSSTIAKIANSASVSVYNGTTLLSTTTLEITASSITGEVTNLPVGTGYTFVLKVFDAEGNLAYSGEASADIEVNKATEVFISVAALTGSAIINGEIVEGIITDTLVIGSKESVKDVTILGGIDGYTSTYEKLAYGNHSDMGIGEYDDNTRFRALLEFSLEELAGKTVKSAELVMTSSGWIEKRCKLPVTIDIHSVLRSWSEGNCAYKANPAPGFRHKGELNSDSVNCATATERFAGEPWNKLMIGIDDVDASSKVWAATTHTISEGDLITWKFNVTELVKAWNSETITNNGILLKSSDDNRSTYDKKSLPVFTTWDNLTQTTYAPKLVITYE